MTGGRATRLVRRARLAAGAVVMALVPGVLLAGCGGPAGGTITVSALFSDVSDLVAGAPVQLQNITVGSVSSIRLDGNAARVVMNVRRSAAVPAAVTAELRQTTILGEHYVDLVPEGGGSGALLRNGAVITHTVVVPGIQELVSAGTQVFAAVNAAQLAQVVDNGAQAFGGQAAQIRQLLDDFGSVLAGYASRSAEIRSVVDELQQLSSSLAPSASANAQALANLSQTTKILSDQSGRFEQLLQSLDDLAVQGHAILQNGMAQTEDQINALAAVANQLAAHQQDLATILAALPGHNLATASATVNDYLQIVDDLIVCGIPGGGEGPDATDTCAPNGGGS